MKLPGSRSDQERIPWSHLQKRCLRKRILRRVVLMQPAPVLYADHFAERGIELFRAVCEHGLEGIVAKRQGGLCIPAETTWVKIKNCSYSQGEGRPEFFESRRAAIAS